MTIATLEHLNITVPDAKATAAALADLFDWHIRWEGPSLDNGHTVHVGDDTRYVALYTPGKPLQPHGSNYSTIGGFNHLAVTVDDLDAMEDRVKAQGLETHSHANYEPGRRFYFHIEPGVEVEVVSYA